MVPLQPRVKRMDGRSDGPRTNVTDTRDGSHARTRGLGPDRAPGIAVFSHG